MVLEEIDAVECFLQFRQVDGALRPIVSLAAQVVMAGIGFTQHRFRTLTYASEAGK